MRSTVVISAVAAPGYTISFRPNRACTSAPQRCSNARQPHTRTGIVLACRRKQWPSAPDSAANACLTPGTLCLQPALLTLWAFALVPPAFADIDGVTYDPSTGSAAFTTVAGILYICLVVYFLFRLFQRRAKRATSERLVSSANDDSDDEEEASASAIPEEGKVSVWRSAIGMLQLAAFTVLAYTAATNLESYAVGIDLPSNYTARNLTAALRTTVVAAAYLATFLLAANTVGLAGLTLKIALFGDDGPATPAAKKADPLPKVRITDDLQTVRAAFDAIEEEARRKQEAARREKEEAGKSSKR